MKPVRRKPSRTAGTVDVVVVGAGHSGLAMSRDLSRRGIGHVVLERGEIANAWRTERWDSLRLLTPNWLSRLPGFCYAGDDPDGFMTAGEVTAFVTTYARRIAAPVLCGWNVRRIQPASDGYRVATDRGDWSCRAVVLATGACGKPAVPALASAIPMRVRQLPARAYRNPGQLDPGGVLVVGASATGIQLAEEIQASGRQVTLAVGEHVRMPRTHRGRDIQWWMLAAGLLDQRIEDTDDPARARNVPSPQLIGSPERRTLDLNALARQGVEIVGRLMGVRSGKAQFSGSLANVCALADLKMARLIATLERWGEESGEIARLDGAPRADELAHEFVDRRAEPTCVAAPRLGLDFNSGEIRSIVWATGFRPDFSCLALPVFDRRGNLRHAGGVVDAPGLYVLGLPFLRRRKSSFIHGAGDDVREIGDHLARYLDRRAADDLRGIAV